MRGIITLCGSHRFKDTFEQVAQDLGLAGWIVLRPAFAKDAHEYALPTDGRKGEKQKLDDLHFEKIAMSQAIVVVNVNDYVGKSTIGEIAHARALGKQVYWMNWCEYSALETSGHYINAIDDRIWEMLLAEQPQSPITGGAEG